MKPVTHQDIQNLLRHLHVAGNNRSVILDGTTSKEVTGDSNIEQLRATIAAALDHAPPLVEQVVENNEHRGSAAPWRSIPLSLDKVAPNQSIGLQLTSAGLTLLKERSA